MLANALDSGLLVFALLCIRLPKAHPRWFPIFQVLLKVIELNYCFVDFFILTGWEESTLWGNLEREPATRYNSNLNLGIPSFCILNLISRSNLYILWNTNVIYFHKILTNCVFNIIFTTKAYHVKHGFSKYLLWKSFCSRALRVLLG